jgi:hypothetical protein
VSIHLDQIVPWGRERREYELMFALTGADLGRAILGCGDGPASFNAQMAAEGRRTVSVDPIYSFSAAQIRQRFEETAPTILGQVKATPEAWVWGCHRDLDDLYRARCRALETFLGDYDRGCREGRYVPAALPRLPFRDGAFELALCSHLLFLYSDLLDGGFHIAAVLEMCRVAREVRIFPLLTLDLNRSPHVEPVRRALAERGVCTSIERVEYELQRGGHEMLRIGPR